MANLGKRAGKRKSRWIKYLGMNDITLLLNAAAEGDRGAAEKLSPLIYEELRRLAVGKLARERPGQSLQATALVHETYLRLFTGTTVQQWNSRRHFFGAAAEAMRRILVELARRRNRIRHGGEFQRVDVDWERHAGEVPDADFEALNEALIRLEKIEPLKAEVVKLRYFAGLSEQEIADTLQVSVATVQRWWTFARTWLYAELTDTETR